MSQKIRIPKYTPSRRQKIDPTEFESLEDVEARIGNVDSFPPEYRDYIQFMNAHKTRHPSYNPEMLDKKRLEALRADGKIGFSYNEKDFDGDGEPDVLVWGKKGLKSYNGYTLKPSKWYPDRQFYYDNQETVFPKRKDRPKGYMQNMKHQYTVEQRGMPEALYNRYGVMENWDDFKGKRAEIYDNGSNDRGQTFNYGIKRKPKTRSLKSIFSEIVIDPTIKGLKNVQGKNVSVRFDLTQYNQIVKTLFNEFLLEGVDFGDFRDEMIDYLEGRIDTSNIEGRRAKSLMAKTLKNSREAIIDLIFANATQLQNRAYNYVLYEMIPENLRTQQNINALETEKNRLAQIINSKYGI